MEFEYQWEDVAIDISEVKPGQMFKLVRYPGLIYRCNTVDWARGRLFLEVYEFDLFSDEDLSLNFYKQAELGKKLILNREWGPLFMDVITEKLSYEVS